MYGHYLNSLNDRILMDCVRFHNLLRTSPMQHSCNCSGAACGQIFFSKAEVRHYTKCDDVKHYTSHMNGVAALSVANFHERKLTVIVVFRLQCGS
eukprot:m.90953 g.90953  ORF g.90953 m.90953 type:complete len:95 (-) comp16481_c0_seq4:828-1112(-)